MEQTILETTFIHLNVTKVTGISQRAFMKKKCLTNLIAFYHEMTGLVGERTAVEESSG